MSTITVTNLQGHTSGGDANKVKLASTQTLDVNGTLDVTGATVTGNLPAANLTGALPAISGASLTSLVNVDSHYAFRQLDSQYFTSSTTRMNFYSSGENFSSNGLWLPFLPLIELHEFNTLVK